MANQLVDWWRQTTPQDASLPDDQITVKLGQMAPEFQKQGRDIFRDYPDFASDHQAIIDREQAESRRNFATVGGELSRGAARGYEGLKSTLYGAGAMAAHAVTQDPHSSVGDWFLNKYKDTQADAGAEEHRPAIESMGDVHGVGDAVKYAAGKMGEAVPSIAESMATSAIGAAAGSMAAPGPGTVSGGIGGLVGKQVVKNLIKSGIEGWTEKEIEKAALHGVGDAALKKLVREESRAVLSHLGGAAANLANSYALSGGEIYGNLITNPNVKPEDAFNVAVVAAFPAALADTALPEHILHKSGAYRIIARAGRPVDETARKGFMGFVARLASEVPKDVSMEASTEAFQELVGIAAEKYAETGKLDLSLTPKDIKQIIEAGVGGAAGGIAAAPLAAMHFSGGHAEQPAPTTQETSAVPAVPGAEPAAPVSTEVASPAADATGGGTPPPGDAKDILASEYGINPDGIRELAKRKLAGEDTIAEEATLRPEAARRLNLEVVDQAKQKLEAKSKQESPVVQQAASLETPAVDSTASSTVAPAVETAAPSETQSSVNPEAPTAGDAGADEAEVAKQNAVYLKRNLDSIQSKIDALKGEAEHVSAGLENAKSLAAEYDAADADGKSKLERKIQKYGGRDGLSVFIKDAEARITGDKSGRKGYALRLASLERQKAIAEDRVTRKAAATDDAITPDDIDVHEVNNQPVTTGRESVVASGEATPAEIAEGGRESLTSQLDDGEDHVDADHSGNEKAPVHGYYEAGDAVPAGQLMSELIKSYDDATDSHDRDGAAERLGTLLTTGARSTSESSSFSKRITVWEAPDGSVLMSTSHRRTGKDLVIDKRFRFAVENKIAKKKGATQGIIEMLSAGYRPIASMLLHSERNQGVRKIADVETFKSEFGILKERRGDVASTGTSTVLSDQQQEFVNRDQLDGGDLLSAEEHEIAKSIWDSFTAEFTVAAKSFVDSGNTEGMLGSLLESTTAGKMLKLHDKIMEAGGSEKDLSRSMALQFAKEILAVADSLEIETGRGALQKITEGMPELIATFSNRFKRAAEKIGIPKNGTNESTTERSVSDRPGAGGEAAGDGGVNRQGDSPVQTEASPGGNQAPSSASTGGGETQAGGTSGEPVVANTVESKNRILDMRRQVGESLQSLADSGAVDDDQFMDLQRSLKEATTLPELSEIASEIEALHENAPEVRSRMAQVDPEAHDDVDLEAGRLVPPALMPNSISNILFNIERLKSLAPANLAQPLSTDAMRAKYPSLKEALRKIAITAASDGTEAGAVRAAVAKGMMEASGVDGVSLRLAEKSQLPQQLGRYNLRDNSITAFVGAHLTEDDLQATILEESLHAFTSKLRRQIETNPTSVHQTLRDAVVGLEGVIDGALKAGLKWQQSDSQDRAVVFDEFVAAAMRDPSFQEGLKTVPAALDLGSSKATNVYEVVTGMIARVVKGLIEGFKGLFGVGSPVQSTALDAAVHFTQSLIENHHRLQGDAIKASDGKADTRNRYVDGTLGTGSELTVDHSDGAADVVAEASRLKALQNYLGDTMSEMIRWWEAKGNNKSSSGTKILTEPQAIQRMINDLFSASMPLPDEAKAAIDQALAAQGLTTKVDDNISIHDLEQHSEAPKMARDALNALQSLLFNLRQSRRESEQLFSSGRINERIAETNVELHDTIKQYEDMTFIGKELIKELRRAMDAREDTGAGKIAELLGLSSASGRRAALSSAWSAVRANVPLFSDAIAALSELGLDLKASAPADVQKAVNASTNPNLAPLKNPASLALAIQFGRKRPIVMDLLSTRSSGESSTLRSIIAMAMGTRDDAFDQAKKDLPKLKRVGAAGERILTRLQELKSEHRQMIDQAKLAAEREQFAIDIDNTLNTRIKSLERMLQIESTNDVGSQWKAYNNATYYAPAHANQGEAEVFDGDHTNPNRRVLKRGAEFDGAKVKQDVQKMREWMATHKGLEGTSNYNLMARQVDGLTKLYVDELDANVRRGPAGLMIQFLGSTADRLEQLGLRPAKDGAQMMRSFVANFEQRLRSVDAKTFHEFDEVQRKGVEISKLHPTEFKRQYYDRALGYLETRQDLLDASLSKDQQENVLVKAAVDWMAKDSPMPTELRPVVDHLLRLAGKNGDIIVNHHRATIGLKVSDVMKDGRVVLRNPIGHSLTTSARGITTEIRNLAKAMTTAWREPISLPGGLTDTGLGAGSMATLYASDPHALRATLSSRFTPEVVTKFVTPLVSKTGKSNFNGPEVRGVSDMAKRDNLVQSLRDSGGDVVTFAEKLHALEGGDPSTLPDFVGKTLATFQRYASELMQVSDTTGMTLDDGDDAGLNFLNARQGEDYPWQWLGYKEYGYHDRTRYIRLMAQQAAFGDKQTAWKQSISEARTQLQNFRDEYERAQRELQSGSRVEYDRIMNEGGNKVARQNAAANLAELSSVERRHNAFMAELNGAKQNAGVFQELLGTMAGATVQGFATAATDYVTLIESPFRKFGFSKEGLQFITGSFKNVALEAAGTLTQAFGMQLHQDLAGREETRILNQNGLTDFDALTGRRGIGSLIERYNQELGDELSFSAIKDRFRDQRLKMAAELTRAAAVRAAKGVKVGLEAGIGRAKDDDHAFASLKLMNPFTQGSIWMHRAVARQWLRTVNGAIDKGAAYLKAHPADATDLNFRFSHKSLGYTGKSLTGLKLDNRAWEFLAAKMADCGISLEEAARKRLRGEDPLDFNQVQAALSLAQTEILLNSSPVTRPAWTQDTLAGRIVAPLVGWSLYKTADVAKTMRGAHSQTDLRYFAGAMEALMLGVLPASIAFAFLRDWYDEDILKKKANVLSLKPGATLPAALLDATSRLGTLGIIGEIPNAIVNASTTKEFSVDSRVFAVSSALAMKNVLATIYQQDGTMTYQTVMRPFFAATGGSGYLQNFDAINGLLGLDNAESRLVRRINVSNQLRVAGREMEMDLRTGRGSAVMSNPVRPFVSNMLLAAYANDAGDFRKSYQDAISAAVREFPGEDPYEKVASMFEGMHPLKSVFASRPSTQEYQRLLSAMGGGAGEVSTAIRNLNAYGQQVITRRGGTGIKPFTGTDSFKSHATADYRTLLVN